MSSFSDENSRICIENDLQKNFTLHTNYSQYEAKYIDTRNSYREEEVGNARFRDGGVIQSKPVFNHHLYSSISNF